ncbi:MAG: rhomboid family intramembrane serine protease, partial [Flavobacteriales bacterium]
VSAVLFAYILIHPNDTLIVFPIFFPLPSFVVGILYLFYERFMEKRGGDNVAHDAHLWGALFGVVFTALIKPSLIPGFFQDVRSYFEGFLG